MTACAGTVAAPLTAVGRRQSTALVIVAVLAVPRIAASESALTLDAALLEASVANAQLPAARYEIASSRTMVREARSDRLPSAAIGGDLRYVRPGSPDQSVELFVSGPLYDPTIRPRIRIAQANVTAAVARYRVTAEDLERQVRSQFSALIATETEIVVQREAIARLATYVQTVQLRQAAGEGITADLLNAETQLEAQRAALLDAQLRTDQNRLQLNDLLGRDPLAPLALAPLPEPVGRVPATDTAPWLRTPDVHVAAAETRAASESIALARAERRPSIVYELTGGFLGVQSSQSPGESYGHRILRGFGGSAMLTYNWNIFDFGGYRSRTARAEIDRARAAANQTVTQRAARLAFQRANIQFVTLLNAIEVRSRAVAVARDAYLAADSLYRGGGGTALAVIDAHRMWVDAAIAEANVRLSYRIAEADYLRWGGR